MRKVCLILIDIALFLLGVTCGPGSVFLSMGLAHEGYWLAVPFVLTTGIALAYLVAKVSERWCGESVLTMDPWNPLQ